MRPLIAPLLLLVGCGARVTSIDLPVGPDDEAAIVALIDGESLDVVAIDLVKGGGLDALPTRDWDGRPLELYALYYARPLGALAVDPGPLPRATAEPSRPLPSPDRALRSAITEAPPDLAPVDDLGPLADYRISGSGVARCLAEGGCLSSVHPGDGCVSPCDESADPEPPVRPEPPAAPDFGDCAPWVEREVATRTVCAPRSSGCGALELDLPDEGCTPLPSCPAGDFAEAPAGAKVLYVRPTGAGPGDAPERAANLDAAVAAAEPGTVILLSAGTFDVSRTGRHVEGELRLIGACPAATVFFGTESTAELTLGGGVELAGVSLERVQLAILSGGAVHDLEVRGVPAGASVRIEGGRASADRLSIKNGIAAAVLVTKGATAALSRISIAATFNAGVRGQDGARLSLTDSTIAGVDTTSADALGAGVYVKDANAVLADVAIRGVRIAALFADTGARLVADRVWIEDVAGKARPAAGDSKGEAAAILGWDGGELEVRRAVLSRIHEHGVRVMGAARAQVEDALFSDVVRREISGQTPFAGRGVRAHDLGSVELRRVVFAGIDGPGLSAEGEQTRVTAEDLAIDGALRARAPGDDPAVISVGTGAAVGVTRARLGGNAWAATKGTRLELTDAELRATGRGILLETQATASLSRVRLAGATGAAVVVATQASLDAGDLAIDGVTADGEVAPDFDPGRRPGDGLLAIEQGRITARRVAITAADGAGVLADGPETSLTASDLSILGGAASEGRFTGIGAVATCTAIVELDNFTITGARRASAGFIEFSRLALAVGTLSDGPIGVAELGRRGFDPVDSLDRVVMHATPTPIGQLAEGGSLCFMP